MGTPPPGRPAPNPPPPPPPGPPRQLILDAADKLFAPQVFDPTATAAIAAAAGVPKGLVFYYFPTKDAILSALMSERV
ncbi:helix-turn-helix domain-containing protein, partial [Nocardia abscessus]|uniref:helix-turn-helix domain-containing protein n=1 Tax=Nocardia abscessus TaxID=120957 RepID=UPI003CC7DC76